MAEDITNPNASNPNQSTEGFKTVAQKIGEQDKTLGKIAETSNTTGESIKELLKSQNESNDHLKSATESLDNIADTGKKALQDAAEAKREAKVGGSGGAKELKPDGDKKDDDKKRQTFDSEDDW